MCPALDELSEIPANFVKKHMILFKSINIIKFQLKDKVNFIRNGSEEKNLAPESVFWEAE